MLYQENAKFVPGVKFAHGVQIPNTRMPTLRAMAGHQTLPAQRSSPPSLPCGRASASGANLASICSVPLVSRTRFCSNDQRAACQGLQRYAADHHPEVAHPRARLQTPHLTRSLPAQVSCSSNLLCARRRWLRGKEPALARFLG